MSSRAKTWGIAGAGVLAGAIIGFAGTSVASGGLGSMMPGDMDGMGMMMDMDSEDMQQMHEQMDSDQMSPEQREEMRRMHEETMGDSTCLEHLDESE
ncbi:hypothetical protein [Haloglycomyces albus]|uniref:hypothetical protein n=1 Tax=Haloglycomyces albus TaxID=526067 RepID=UPI00046D58E2|nr:hypothetical protein [Haloglycomyces albus]